MRRAPSGPARHRNAIYHNNTRAHTDTSATLPHFNSKRI